MLIEIIFVHLTETKKKIGFWIFTVLQQIEDNGIVVVTLLFKITMGGLDVITTGIQHEDFQFFYDKSFANKLELYVLRLR